MPSKESLADEFLTKIKVEEANFDDCIYPLNGDQLVALDVCCKLFRQGSTNLSKAQRYRQLRARKLLQHVFLHHGAELFLLCALAVSVTDLGKQDQKILLPKLRSWWKGIEINAGLAATAGRLCADNKVGELVSVVSLYSKGRSSAHMQKQRLRRFRSTEKAPLLCGLPVIKHGR